jgi:hypothetical protein
MDLSVPEAVLSELAPAYFQAIVTVALAVLCATLHRRYRKPYLLAWTVAWLVYALRMGAIISFMHTEDLAWLYWHQVFTGWTAIALLWAAMVFWRQTPLRAYHVVLVLFPPVWSFMAIYRLDNFLLAAGPAVLFLSGATLATGWAFFRYHRETASAAAMLAATAMLLWAFHHLDYPFLRARGVWNPWGYYLARGVDRAVGAFGRAPAPGTARRPARGTARKVADAPRRAGQRTLLGIHAGIDSGGCGGGRLPWVDRARSATPGKTRPGAAHGDR